MSKSILIYHPFSPFSRIVYMLALERSLTHHLTLHKVVVCPVDPYPGWSDNNAEVSISNPIAKIPTLILDPSDPSTALFDSRVICEYLDHLSLTQGHRQDTGVPKNSNLYFAHQAIIAATMGIMDAEVLCAYEERIRSPLNLSYQPWHDGMRLKVSRGLDFLESALKKGNLRVRTHDEGVDTADICVAVVCGFCEARQIEWRKGRELLGEYFDKTWRERRSWVETPVTREWDKMGEEKL
jgi:glutathione S-transferase